MQNQSLPPAKPGEGALAVQTDGLAASETENPKAGETPSRPNPEKAAKNPPTPPKNPADGPMLKAREWLGNILRIARASGIHDQNAIGLFENAFEDAKNAVAGNRATKETLLAAHRALETAAHLFANHSKIGAGDLEMTREAAAATKSAAGQIK